jgi:hypothetical protein
MRAREAARPRRPRRGNRWPRHSPNMEQEHRTSNEFRIHFLWLALILTFSPWEKEKHLCGSGFADDGLANTALDVPIERRTILPLLGGEGRGEVEPFSNRHKSVQAGWPLPFPLPALRVEGTLADDSKIIDQRMRCTRPDLFIDASSWSDVSYYPTILTAEQKLRTFLGANRGGRPANQP